VKHRRAVKKVSSHLDLTLGSLPRRVPKRRGDSGRGCRLEAPGWNEETRSALEVIINKGAGQRLPVVFDFDNTVICGDIGEATLAVLAQSGVLTPAKLGNTTSRPFGFRARI